MFTSNNKQESRELIKTLDLNTVPEIFVKNDDEDKIREFFNNNKASKYVVRDGSRSSSTYYYVYNADEAIEKAKKYNGLVIVAVSINSYENKILLGAIQINADDTVRFCGTTNKELDHRTMYRNPEFDYDTTIIDKKLSNIPKFDMLYEYVSKHQLHGLTIEFTIYDRPVGNKNEYILINELRNY